MLNSIRYPSRQVGENTRSTSLFMSVVAAATRFDSQLVSERTNTEAWDARPVTPDKIHASRSLVTLR